MSSSQKRRRFRGDRALASSDAESVSAHSVTIPRLKKEAGAETERRAASSRSQSLRSPPAALRPLTALPAHCRRASRVAGRNPFQTGTKFAAYRWSWLSGTVAMSKNDVLRYGAPGETAVHLCVDMQRMFAESTEWKMPWLERVLPNILSITSTHPEKTIFTRPIPARQPGQGVGMWRHHYERWGSMTIDQLGSEMIGLVPDLAKYVPPARTFDKHVYSPWTGTDLHQQLRGAGIDTVVVTGGETDVCVLATMLGASTGAFALSLSPTRSAVRRMKPTTR